MEPETGYSLDPEAGWRRQARRRAKVKMSFYAHAAGYLVVNLLLVAIDGFTGPGWWFYWALFGWGIGLGAHGFGVFAPRAGASLLRRLEEREYRRLANLPNSRAPVAKSSET